LSHSPERGIDILLTDEEIGRAMAYGMADSHCCNHYVKRFYVVLFTALFAF